MSSIVVLKDSEEYHIGFRDKVRKYKSQIRSYLGSTITVESLNSGIRRRLILGGGRIFLFLGDITCLFLTA